MANLVSPPMGRDEGTFSIPSVRRPAFDALPDPQYSYLERIRSYAPPVARRVSIFLFLILKKEKRQLKDKNIV